jgi:hypothetical protein
MTMMMMMMMMMMSVMMSINIIRLTPVFSLITISDRAMAAVSAVTVDPSCPPRDPRDLRWHGRWSLRLPPRAPMLSGSRLRSYIIMMTTIATPMVITDHTSDAGYHSVPQWLQNRH